ncbi:MAG: DnaJ domain-containing protein [Rhodobiaceae bacterium]|nr:DnaJ domain-containing protein [Rhodobiaceae bacterium]
MPYLFFGLVALVVLLLAARAFVAANPRTLAVIVRRTGGALVLVLAGLLTVTGRWFLALPLAAFGLGLLTGRSFSFGGLGQRTRRTAGRTSSVRTVFLDMALDHDSGKMNGRVLAGRFDGALLSDLDYTDLMTLRDECRRDPQSLALLETYLDRTHPDWRADWHDEETEADRRERARSGGPMTREEARAILGVEVGVSADEIRRAHRQLMKRFHPDHGGSDYLAAKINEAKDTLLQDF